MLLCIELNFRKKKKTKTVSNIDTLVSNNSMIKPTAAPAIVIHTLFERYKKTRKTYVGVGVKVLKYNFLI
jgi:hypothetical protein